jgi:hypothetical protein
MGGPVPDNLNEPKRAARRALADYIGVKPGPSGSRVWVFTDQVRRWFADCLAEAALELRCRAWVTCLAGDFFSAEDLGPVKRMLALLGPDDVVVSAFSDYSMGRIPFSAVFPNFRSPEGFRGKSAAIRAHYPDDALVQHLLTPPDSVDAVAARYLALSNAGRVRVTSGGGTDFECEIGKAILLPYKVGSGERHAFLPPAEVAFGITAGTARGLLIADITASDIVIGGKTVARLGLVDEPIRVEMSEGRISSISGGRTAETLRDWLERLGPESRLAVELGFGLSEGVPTGSGSADECLQGTFHVGFGDDSFFNKLNKAPVHLDLICRGPRVTRIAVPRL